MRGVWVEGREDDDALNHQFIQSPLLEVAMV
jgi:hypothetical protein